MKEMTAPEVGKACEEAFNVLTNTEAGSIQVISRDKDGNPLLMILLATCPVEIEKIRGVLDEDS